MNRGSNGRGRCGGGGVGAVAAGEGDGSAHVILERVCVWRLGRVRK